MKKLSFLFAMVLLAASSSVAMADQSQYKKVDLSKSSSYKRLNMPLPNDSVKKHAGFTLSTNLLEWAVMAPNFGIEFDLKDPTLMSQPSLVFDFSFRPSKDFFKTDYTNTKVAFWRARFEYRWHFRFNERQEQRRGLTIAANWIDEKVFTKKVDTEVPDTAGINAGNPYATKTVKSRQPLVDRKIDSTMVSTLQKRDKMFPGRWYAGIYGEGFGYSMNNAAFDWIFGSDKADYLKHGLAASVGLSFGYDFPGFNYNHKFFMQWSVGGSIGAVYAFKNEYYYHGVNPGETQLMESGGKFLPMPITGLRVALNFRNTTISQKYWQPDNSRYLNNIRMNHDDSIHMAEIDSILAANPVVIEVHSVNGFDSTYIELIDKNTIVNAFRRSTGLNYLLPSNFNMLESTDNGIKNKELSDNYFIEYVTRNRLRNYEDSVYVNDRKNLKFGIEIAGRAHADSLMQSFKDSLTNFFQANNSRPIIYGIPASRDSLKGYISKDTIAAVFSRIWGHTLDTTMIRGLYTNRTVVNDDGTTTTFLDSLINDTDIKYRDQYGMFIQFHPQITLSAEDYGVARFRVAMEGADIARTLFNNVATYYNTLAKIGIPRIQRTWNGKDDTFEQRVTKEEVLALMVSQGLQAIDSSMVEMNDSIYAFNNLDGHPDTLTFHFGVTESDLKIPFLVEDSVGKAQGQTLYQVLREWYASNYWTYLPDDDPIVPAFYDSINDTWMVSKARFIESLAKIEPLSGVTILPYQVDTVVQRVQKARSGVGYAKNSRGYYRGYAQFKFHREIRNRSGAPLTMRVVYQLDRKQTMAEAGVSPDMVNGEVPVQEKSTVEQMLEEDSKLDEVKKQEHLKVELFDSLGHMYNATIYRDSLGNNVYVMTDSDSVQYRLILDEFGDVKAKESKPFVIEDILKHEANLNKAPHEADSLSLVLEGLRHVTDSINEALEDSIKKANKLSQKAMKAQAKAKAQAEKQAKAKAAAEAKARAKAASDADRKAMTRAAKELSDYQKAAKNKKLSDEDKQAIADALKAKGDYLKNVADGNISVSQSGEDHYMKGYLDEEGDSSSDNASSNNTPVATGTTADGDANKE